MPTRNGPHAFASAAARIGVGDDIRVSHVLEDHRFARLRRPIARVPSPYGRLNLSIASTSAATSLTRRSRRGIPSTTRSIRSSRSRTAVSTTSDLFRVRCGLSDMTPLCFMLDCARVPARAFAFLRPLRAYSESRDTPSADAKRSIGADDEGTMPRSIWLIKLRLTSERRTACEMLSSSVMR